MEVFFFTFRSVTSAMRAQQLLSEASIGSGVVRTPGPLRKQGCGYSLRVTAAQAALAAQCLRQAGASYQRIYQQAAPGDAPVEVVL